VSVGFCAMDRCVLPLRASSSGPRPSGLAPLGLSSIQLPQRKYRAPHYQEVISRGLCEGGSGAARGRAVRGPCLCSKPPGKTGARARCPLTKPVVTAAELRVDHRAPLQPRRAARRYLRVCRSVHREPAAPGGPGSGWRRGRRRFLCQLRSGTKNLAERHSGCAPTPPSLRNARV
jgi:hypothetical protein